MRILCITPVAHINGLRETLERYGEVTYMGTPGFDDTKAALLDGYDIIFVNPNMLTFKLDEILLAGTNVSIIVTASTGTNHIDCEYCRENGIKVLSLTNERQIINEISSTAEHSFALMLALIRKIPSANRSAWCGNWDYRPFIGRQLNSMVAGIVGFGRLGTMMAHYCSAFRMSVLVYDPFKDVVPVRHNFAKAELDALAAHSDVVSVHVHYSKETVALIGYDFIEKTNRKPYIINTSRGGIVDELAVIDGLRRGKISGYATDVLAHEFGNVRNSPVIAAAREGLNILITPHIGGMTKEAQEIAYIGAADLLGGPDVCER